MEVPVEGAKMNDKKHCVKEGEKEDPVEGIEKGNTTDEGCGRSKERISFDSNLRKFGREFKEKRIENLRKMRSNKSLVPNTKAKLWAIRIMDEIKGREGICLPSNSTSLCHSTCAETSPNQKSGSPTGANTTCNHYSGSSNGPRQRATLSNSTSTQSQSLSNHNGPQDRATLKYSAGTQSQPPDNFNGPQDRATLMDSTDALSCTCTTLSSCPTHGCDCNTLNKLEGNVNVNTKENVPPLQSLKLEEYTVVGNDVEALFPSLTDLESARIAREAVETSELKFENVDAEAALKYLRVTGGDDHIKEIGLARVAPRWRGSRPDLLTLGGEALAENCKWTKMKRELSENELRLVISRVVETAVLICMSTHVYRFGPNLYIQCTGGPIGMRFTASLASVIMKQWDKSWVKLLKREKVKFDLFLRYVDDCRLFMPALNPGWIWKDGTFIFSKEQAASDERDGITFIQRTTREVTKAMCDLTDFLKFTGEDCSDFSDNTLPTLDTTLWVHEGQIKYKFFEKPTVGNQVLNHDTALPVSSLRSSLLQETVRRLLYCSEDLEVAVKQEILSKFASKLINSGHSVKSARILIVQGVVKFQWKQDLNNLPKEDPRYKPLHLAKEYCEQSRQVMKYQAKMSWYKPKSQDVDQNVPNNGWKKELRGIWRGTNVSQRPVLENGFTTVLSVPNTLNAELAKRLIKCETGLAKITKYNVKIVEKSGIQLGRLFQKVYTPDTCHIQQCPVCIHKSDKGKSKCRFSNVVYEACCMDCADAVGRGEIPADKAGVYIGETSRTLNERATEHVTAAGRLDTDNFITKHWASNHRGLTEPPRIQFKVLRRFKDALSRQVSEAIWIEQKANLNSRTEWGKNSLTRLKVDGVLNEEDSSSPGEETEEAEGFLNKMRVKIDAEKKKSKNADNDRKREGMKGAKTGSKIRKLKEGIDDQSYEPVHKKRRRRESLRPQARVDPGGDDNEVPVMGIDRVEDHGAGEDDNEDPVMGKDKVEAGEDDNEDPVGGNKVKPSAESPHSLQTSMLSHVVAQCNLMDSGYASSVAHYQPNMEIEVVDTKTKVCVREWKNLLNGTVPKKRKRRVGSSKKETKKDDTERMNIVRHLVKEKARKNTGSTSSDCSKQISNEFTKSPPARVVNNNIKNIKPVLLHGAVNCFVQCYRSKLDTSMVNDKLNKMEENLNNVEAGTEEMVEDESTELGAEGFVVGSRDGHQTDALGPQDRATLIYSGERDRSQVPQTSES